MCLMSILSRFIQQFLSGQEVGVALVSIATEVADEAERVDVWVVLEALSLVGGLQVPRCAADILRHTPVSEHHTNVDILNSRN